MYEFECEATFEAEPDAVWKVWTDVARWPDWDVSKEMARQMPILLRTQSNYLAITQARVHNIPPLRRGLVRLNEVWVDAK